jgi:hypothetical protein
MTPRVSIIITAYRRQTYLMDAIRSVLDSSAGRDTYEIILAIDQIEDELARSVRQLGVTILQVESNRGGEMWVAGIRAASGEVLAFLDDDDCFLPDKVAHLLEVFADPDVIWYHHGYRRVGEDRRPLSNGPPVRRPPRTYSAPLTRADLARIRISGGIYNNTCHAVRRDRLLEHAEAFHEVTFGQDFAIATLISGKGKVVIDVTNILSEFRTHWSQGSQPYHGSRISDAHHTFLTGIVRTFCWLAQTAPTSGARTFSQCRADSYDAILWATRRESVQASGGSFLRSVQAVLGNLEEGDYFNATVLALLISTSAVSPRLTESVYTALKRVEMRGIGLELPRLTPRVRSGDPIARAPP